MPNDEHHDNRYEDGEPVETFEDYEPQPLLCPDCKSVVNYLGPCRECGYE